MRLISIDPKTKARTYELTPNEALAVDRLSELLDEGHGNASAADVVRKEFQAKGLSLSDSFITWLSE